MKILIEKADGSPMKSRLSATNYLKKIGVPMEALIEEKGYFYYLDDFVEEAKEEEKAEEKAQSELTWETPVYKVDGENTKVYFKKDIAVTGTLRAKHPAGQNRTSSAMEIVIEGNGYIIPVELAKRIFEV